MPAAGQEGADPFPRLLHGARHLQPEDLGLPGRRRIAARDLRQVGPVHAGSGDAHQDFIGLWDRQPGFAQLGDVPGVLGGGVQELHHASGLEQSVTHPVAPEVRLPGVMLTTP